MPFFRRHRPRPTGEEQQKLSRRRSDPVTSSIRASRTFGTPASILSRMEHTSTSSSLSDEALAKVVEDHLAGFDKASWGNGPWIYEPDDYYVEFFDVPCYASRHPVTGNWCGYVELSDEHPWAGQSGDEIDAFVHGGVTFSDRFSKLGDGWFIGFDCGHSGDVAPAHDARRKRAFDIGVVGGADDDFKPTYKTLQYVLGELKELARQARDAAKR